MTTATHGRRRREEAVEGTRLMDRRDLVGPTLIVLAVLVVVGTALLVWAPWHHAGCGADYARAKAELASVGLDGARCKR